MELIRSRSRMGLRVVLKLYPAGVTMVPEGCNGVCSGDRLRNGVLSGSAALSFVHPLPAKSGNSTLICSLCFLAGRAVGRLPFLMLTNPWEATKVLSAGLVQEPDSY